MTGPASLDAVLGDLTEQQVDAVVNAADSTLLGGGGVDGAIHRVGGPEVLAACRVLRSSAWPDGLPAGEAVATTAGRLPAAHVIHTVGPVFDARSDRSGVLSAAYRSSLRVADELGAHTVAFPAISAGAYRWPLGDAARIAVETVRATATRVELVRFVLLREPALAAFRRALAAGPS